MGLYDILPKGSQVKLWCCEMQYVNIGDSVPNFDLEEYIVLLREGGYIRVRDGIVTEIVEDGEPRGPEDFEVSCFDKWGNFVMTSEDLEGVGYLGEDYYFEEEIRKELEQDDSVS